MRCASTSTTTKPAALHDGDGYIDYGNGTASYYYSWTRMDVTGALDLGQGWQQISGEAWMDHQWGDFATYQEGGWDWFSVQLEDETDVMLYLIRDAEGQALRVDGSIVSPDGELSVLREGDFVISADGEWTSPETGTTYPSGWTITVPDQELAMSIMPSLPDQELDTRATTGVIYWEGEAVVAGHASWQISRRTRLRRVDWLRAVRAARSGEPGGDRNAGAMMFAEQRQLVKSMKKAQAGSHRDSGSGRGKGETLQPDEARGAPALDALVRGPVGVVCIRPSRGAVESLRRERTAG